MLLAMAWYYFPVYGGVHWFRGPTFNVEEKTSSRRSVGDEVSTSGEDDGGAA